MDAASVPATTISMGMFLTTSLCAAASLDGVAAAVSLTRVVVDGHESQRNDGVVCERTPRAARGSPG